MKYFTSIVICVIGFATYNQAQIKIIETKTPETEVTPCESGQIKFEKFEKSCEYLDLVGKILFSLPYIEGRREFNSYNKISLIKNKKCPYSNAFLIKNQSSLSSYYHEWNEKKLSELKEVDLIHIENSYNLFFSNKYFKVTKVEFYEDNPKHIDSLDKITAAKHDENKKSYMNRSYVYITMVDTANNAEFILKESLTNSISDIEWLVQVSYFDYLKDTYLNKKLVSTSLWNKDKGTYVCYEIGLVKPFDNSKSLYQLCLFLRDEEGKEIQIDVLDRYNDEFASLKLLN